MIRDNFSNKWIIGAVFVLLIVAAGCILYYQHTTAPLREQAAKVDKMLKQMNAEKQKQTAASDTTSTQTSADSKTKTAKKSKTDTTPKTKNRDEGLQIGDIVDGRIYLGTEPPSPELLAEFGVHPPSQDEIISPYGFGPYPELPEGFGPITWPRKNANSELMIRVKIKLLKQGVPVRGSIMENGLVYPILKGVRYVIWGESDGRRYLRRSLGHPDDGDYMRKIEKEKKDRRESVTEDDFPGIKLVPFEEAGIDPYTFLDLPK